MAAVNNIFTSYTNPIFIETGSYMGNGIRLAIDAGFTKIYSIELSPKYFQICKKRFQNHNNVEVLHGDSYKVLPTLLNSINQPVTFWLDGHHSCGDTALGDYWAPLIKELEAICNHPIKNHTILVDDMRCWENYNPVHGFSKDDIVSKLMEINEKYEISYIDGAAKNDILVAKIK